MDANFFPNIIDYWGPNGHDLRQERWIRYTPYKTDNASFFSGPGVAR
jgi:hypothetical protein